MKIAIQGICYDDKSSFLKGQAKAPPLIRECLHNGSSSYFTESGIDLEEQGLEDKGDFEVEDYFDIEKLSLHHLQGSYRLFSLGGDHSITFPIVKAVHQIYGKVDLLLFDAHTDLYDIYEGDKYSHACPFARIMESGLVENLVQVGIRVLSPHQKEQAEKFGVTVIQARDFDLNKIPEFKNPLYISLDMDAFDPGFAPGVSHHESGGLTPRQVLQVIQQIEGPLVSADLVEYNPTRDNHQMTAALASKMMKEILGKMIENVPVY